MAYVVIVIVLLLAAGAAYQAYGVRKAKETFRPTGRMVTLPEGERMHVDARGDGPRVVLLAGWGCFAPSLDFDPLRRELLARGFRAVVVEKPGYGFSPVHPSKRTIDHVVEEMHSALALAGEEGPYILCGHSLAGTEVLRWACLHPDEIAGVMTLDAPAPLCYTHLPTPPAILNLARAGMRFFGLARLMNHLPAFRTRTYQYLNNYRYMDQALMPQVEQMQLMNALNSSVRQEIALLKENAKVAGDTMPQGIKLVMLIASDTKERLYTMIQPEQDDYIAKNHAVTYVLEGKHNLQHYAPRQIAELMAKEFAVGENAHA